MQAQASGSFLSTLLAGAAPGGARQWLKQLRANALERANALSAPTMRDEDWRFTDLTPLYRLALHAPGESGAVDVEAHRVAEAGSRLVFVNGAFREDLSEGIGASGLEVVRLRGEFADAPWLSAHLGQIAAFAQDAFVAANTAAMSDAVAVRVPRGVTIDKPLHCLFLNTEANAVSHPRLLVVAESGSDMLFVEDHIGMVDGAYCDNAVVEISVAEKAEVRHVRLQREGKAAYHIGTSAASVARDGRYRCWSVAMGARLSRHNANVRQDGEGTHFEMDGLALLGARQLADTHSFIDHARADGTSRQMHKCVVADGAHAVFNGRILVREGAQQTNSTQESRNLLLSDKARVDTKPQLEIFADDVKCAHGATVGQLEAEEVFYLRSRGLAEPEARNLLTYAFAADMVVRIPVPSVVRALQARIIERTGGPEIP
jgi:Fe-S cluster assembly protein SufD